MKKLDVLSNLQYVKQDVGNFILNRKPLLFVAKSEILMLFEL